MAQREKPIFAVREDDLSSEQIRALLASHVATMRSASPPGTSYALDLSGLQTPDITVWSAWRDNRIAGVGALKMLGNDSAEIKSMKTHPGFLRMGVAGLILETIIENALARGLKRLSLETGTGPAFEAALTLYYKRGFRNGPVFGDYRESNFNQFLHLEL